jgi:hypothetical protein
MSGRDFVRSLPGGSLPAVRRLNNMHLDPLLLAALLAVIAFGLVVLFSALGKDIAIFDGQVIRILLALTIMIVAAQFEPGVYLRWTPLVVCRRDGAARCGRILWRDCERIAALARSTGTATVPAIGDHANCCAADGGVVLQRATASTDVR